MTGPPDQYGVIGHPVAHSLSPFIHGLFARATGESLTYRLFDVKPEMFRGRVLDFFGSGGKGLNVTVPHKIAAAEIANELTPRAARAGAVNTLALRDNRLLGDNTDGAGLVRDLHDHLGVSLSAQHVLVVGAGGAARGVIAPLFELGPVDIVVANRTEERARALAADFSDLGAISGSSFEALAGQTFGLVLNATSASLDGSVPPLPEGIISADSVCYDMVYGKSETPFMRWALDRGCGCAVQGWGMLVEQAAESFLVWRGVRPDTAPVLEALRRRLLSAPPG